MTPPQREAVAMAPLFSGLNDSELSLLCESLSEKQFAAGESLFEQGDECRGLFLLAKGSVRILRHSDDGSEMTVAVETAPAAIAELPLFDDGPYPASANAIEPVTAFFICKKDFRQVCIRNPEVALKVLATVGRRLRVLLELFERMSLETLRQRLARMLLDQSGHAHQDNFRISGSLDEIASHLNSVREVVARNLAYFEEAGAISIQGVEMKILRREYLERLAAGDI